MLILRNYRSVGDNAARLFDQFLEGTQHEEFDVEESGARMLGHDMRRLLNEAGAARAAAIIRPQARLVSGELAADMDRRSPGRAHRLLQALFDEFLQARV